MRRVDPHDELISCAAQEALAQQHAHRKAAQRRGTFISMAVAVAILVIATVLT